MAMMSVVLASLRTLAMSAKLLILSWNCLSSSSEISTPFLIFWMRGSVE